jgi:DNA-binding response OmpR family regulator
LLQADHTVTKAEVTALQGWITALRQEIEHSYGETSYGETSYGETSYSETIGVTTADRPLLLIVDHDLDLAQALAEAAKHEFRVETAANLTRARDKILLESPDVLLLDPASATTAESLSLFAELNQQVHPVPVVIFSQQDDLTERLKAARLGGRSFLPKSTPVAQVIETLNQVLHQADRAKVSVMIVDDDPQLLAVVRALLEPWGLKVTSLARPQQFWHVLAATSPDLLVLDIEMPQISGLELCQIVRSDPRWSGLPILFLTAHTDADSVNQVFLAGADDLVSKPIVGPELVTRIINRLDRIRSLKSQVQSQVTPSNYAILEAPGI